MNFDELRVTARTLRRAGLIQRHGPRRLLAARRALGHWGVNYAGGFASAAALYPDRPMVIDERGQLTWAEIDEQSNRLARYLAGRGVSSGSVVGILCRNHRWFILATAALAKLGADVLYLNTGFAAPQLAEVTRRENTFAIIHDAEFAGMVDEAVSCEGPRLIAWPEGEDTQAGPSIAEIVAGGPAQPPAPPDRLGRTIILTSGTTGTPKGAPREQVSDVGPVVAMLERIPYRVGDVAVVPAPLFHSWGFGNLSLSILLGSTVVLRRRFDPEETLADIARHRAQVLVAVPVMLQRILELPDAVRRNYDTSSLRIVPLSGSAIPGDLATRWMDLFGDNIYNLYGSTEVGWGTIATPRDLRAHPSTAGRPPLRTRVELLDERDMPVPRGDTGRIFVGSELTFDGYTSGEDKARVGDLVSTGDTGHFDASGLLFVDGRDDEMIVSGGENVFPRELEDLLAADERILEAAVVGVDDEEFGRRLKAFVVLRVGAVLEEDAVKEMVRANLASFKVPREVVFLAELPRNPTGKVLKRQLA